MTTTSKPNAFIAAPIYEHTITEHGLITRRYDTTALKLQCRLIGYEPIVVDDLLDYWEDLMSGIMKLAEVRALLLSALHECDTVFIPSDMEDCPFMMELTRFPSWKAKKKLHFADLQEEMLDAPGLVPTVLKRIKDALITAESSFNEKWGWFFTNGMKAYRRAEHHLPH